MPKISSFIGPSYTLRSPNVDCQRSVNLFPEMNEMQTGKEQEVAALLSTPGLSLIRTLGTSPHRGGGAIKAANGRVFMVSGNTVYEINADLTATSRGAIGTATGPVSMADNGVQLIIVDGSATGYIFTYVTNTLAAIADADFPGANQVVFQDGYFIVNRPNTNQFFISALYDGTNWNGLDLGSKEAQPDNIQALISDHRELWLFGSSSSEVWFNSGNANFPFRRTATLEHGIDNAFTAQKIDNSIFWVSKRDGEGFRMVVKANGYQSVRVSTHAVELAIQGYGEAAGATSWTYQKDGHSFYCLNFPTAQTTWVLDLATMLWHERTYGAGQLSRHRAQTHVFAFGKHLVGDYDNGNLYELSDLVNSDNNQPLTRMRISSHASKDLKYIFYDKIQFDLEVGVGLDGSEQGVGRTNYLLRSQEFDNAVWGVSGNAPAVTANTQADPNGNLLADSLAFNPDATHESYISQSSGLVPTNGQQYTFSCWLKAASPVAVNLRLVQSTGQNDVVVAQSVTTSWQRFSMTVTMAGVGSGGLLARIGQQPNSIGVTVFAWGAQLEPGSVATPYIATAGAAVTDNTRVSTDPQVMFQYSDNSGRTWSNEKWASLGKIGQFLTRIIYKRCGRSRDRVFKLVITDPVKVTLIGARFEGRMGTT